MKIYQYLPAILFCCTILFSCDSSSSNNTAGEPATGTEARSDGEVVQTEENIDMQEEEKQNADTTNNREVVAQSLQFTPAEIRAKPNERIQVTLINKGDVPYSLKFDLPDGAQELRESVQPGTRAGLIFTTPKKKGTYNFYSPITNHRDRGMTGKLIVE